LFFNRFFNRLRFYLQSEIEFIDNHKNIEIMQTHFSFRKFFLLLFINVCAVVSLQAQDRAIPLGSSDWKLWLDRNAVWKTDTLIVPPADLSKLAVNPPTGGWANLFAKSVALSSVQTIISDPSYSVNVTVPGTVEEFCWDALSGNGKGLGSSGNYEGVSWWGKDFNVPAEAQGKRIKLYFSGGVRQRAEVFVNETLVGYELAHQEAFEVDITDAVDVGGTNKLAVRITDANGNFSWGDYTGTLWGDDYYFPLSHAFGGILGEVKMKIVNPAYVSDVFVKNKPALRDIDAEIEIRNDGATPLNGTISVEIVENWKGNAAASNPQTIYTDNSAGTFSVNAGELDTVTFSASVPEALLWEIKNANLYDFVVTLKDAGGNVLDKYTQRFGFRFLSVEGYGTDARFYFNGRRTFLLSAISWGFWPTNGMYPTPELARKHIASAQTLGQNMLNFHRCQGNDIVLNLADEMGILYYEEPGGYTSSRVKADNQAAAKAKYFDVATKLNSRRLLRMVKQHRNHPSLVYYNMVNEPGWDPDAQAKQDMAAAHLLDPTRFISYGSGFMGIGADQPHKLHMLPYDQTQRTVGFVDIHNAGNSPGVYTDNIYNSPQNFWRNEQGKGEILIWGEEGALASPPQLELIQDNIASVGYNGWDGADYKDWYNAYVNYFQKKKLTSYYPSITSLITSLGNIQYYEHGRMIENARIADDADLYVLNGYEDMKFDNFSGCVDVFRNLKGTPELVSQYMRPLMVSVKLRNKVGAVGDINLLDLYILNEHAIPAGTYTVKAKVSKPDGSQQEIFAGTAQVSGGDKFSDLVKDAVEAPLDGGKGYYYITAELLDASNQKIADGHDEIFVVDWASDAISGKGAVVGGEDILGFARDVKGANVVPYEENLGKLNYIILGAVDNGADFRATSPSNTRTTADGTVIGLTLEYYQGKAFNTLVDTRVSTERIDFDVKNKLIPGWDILGTTNFSLRWTGYIIGEVTGEVEYSLTFDDGARVYFDNALKINSWGNGPEKTLTFKVNTEKGKLYPVKIEAYQDGGTWLCAFKRKIPAKEDTLDLDKLLTRISKDGTHLLVLEDGESWVKTLQGKNALPAAGIFHPAKTWVGHNFFVREHPFFNDLPVNGGMNWEYQRLAVYDGINHFGLYNVSSDDEEAVVSLVGGQSHLVATSVGIIPYGRGKIVYSSLDLAPNLILGLKASNVPKKIFCNILNWAAKEPASPALDRTGWIATASSSSGSDVPSRTLDNSLTTRWSSGIFQKGDEWFQMDMLEPQTFNRILLKQGTTGTADYPRGYELYLSDDETSFGNPVLTGEGTEGAATVIELPEAETSRFVRIVQTGTSANKWWSIHEFGVESDLASGIAASSVAEGNQPFFYQNGLLWIKGVLTPFTVKIYNLAGQLLKSLVSSQPVIDLRLVSGLYLVAVENSTSVRHQKVWVN
jgi:hypothetical protein